MHTHTRALAGGSPPLGGPPRPLRPSQGLSLGLSLGLPLALLACDSAPSRSTSTYTLAFESPEEGRELTCADDLNRDTVGVIERDVTLTVVAPADARPDLVVALSVIAAGGEAPWVEQRRGLAGLVEGAPLTFEALPFPPGDYTLSARLLNGDEVKAEGERALSATVDPADPLCAVPEATLTFLSPVDGATLSAEDDLNADLSDGLQVDLQVRVEGEILNNRVALELGGAQRGEAQAQGGVATFSAVTLPTSGEVLARVSAQGPLGAVEARATFSVEVGACELSASPMPVEGCDLSGAVDLDPSLPGLQTTLTATTTCAQVTWVINGVAYEPVEAVAGEASLLVTLPGGENAISVRGDGPNGRAALLPTYVLDVSTERPTLSVEGLSLAAQTRLSLSDAAEVIAEGARGQARWRFNGFTTDLAEGERVALSFEPASEGAPAIEGAPTEARVDADGRFSFDLTGGDLCGVTLRTQALDPCGAAIAGPTYELCLDAVTPRLALSSPTSSELIVSASDLDPATPGVQLDLGLTIEDARAVAAYPVTVACRLGAAGALEVVSAAPVTRDALRQSASDDARYEGVTRVTLPQLGTYECLALANSGLNAPVTPTLRLRLVDEAPRFELLDPSPVAGGACAEGSLLIGGRGALLDPALTTLSFTLVDQTGAVARSGSLALNPNQEGALEPLYSAEVPVGDGGLTPGRYTLTVSGTVSGAAPGDSGDIPVLVTPAAAVSVVVGGGAPSVGLASPATLGAAQDANGDLADCVQAPVRLAVSDPGALLVCYALNGGLPTCAPAADALSATGELVTPALNLLPGDNSLRVTLSTCSAPDGSSEFATSFTLTAEGCGEPLYVAAPLSGATLTPLDDEDPATEPWEITARLRGPAGLEVTLEVAGLDAPLSVGPVTLDPTGAATLSVALPAPLTPTALTLTPVSGALRGLSSPLTLSPASPTLELVSPAGVAPCVNLAVADASSAAGFQLPLSATASGLSPSPAPALTVRCGAAPEARAEGRLSPTAALFGLVTLADGECEASVNATTLSGAPLASSVRFVVDREAPALRLVSPPEGQTLSFFDDEDVATLGIQVSTSVEACGAGGVEVSLSTSPAQTGGDLTGVPGGDDCETLALGPITLGASSLPVTLRATDACGNETLATRSIDANTNTALSIISPRADELISVADDGDAARLGCQLNVSATTTGFASLTGVTFALCASDQLGLPSELCGADVDASQGLCRALDPEGRSLSCPVTLAEGGHSLTLVARSGATLLRSAAVPVYSDCSPPATVSLNVAEDVDGNACLNRLERSNPDAVNSNATFTVDYLVVGLSDGAPVTLKVLPGARTLGQSQVSLGRGVFSGVSLAEGEHSLYLVAQDRAQNPIAGPTDAGFFARALRVDVTAPAPALLELAANECLGVADDLNVTAPHLQYAPRATTGADPGEQVEMSVRVDGVTVQRVSTSASDVTFNPVQLTAGARALTVLSQDLCGNLGSAGGFSTLNGRPNWSAPLGVPVLVDITAPTLAVTGLAPNATLVEADDADGDASNGFQVDLGVQVSDLEAGREVRLYSGESRLVTSPAVALAAAGGAQTIPVRVTLPPGPHALNARGTDACGNAARSPSLNATVNIVGCSSALVSHSGLPLLDGGALGPQDGVVVNDLNGAPGARGLTLEITGRVDLFNPACAGASASLVSDGVVVAQGVVDPLTGAVTFPAATLPEANQDLRLRVVEPGSSTDSLGLNVAVDLSAPTLLITAPARDAGGTYTVVTDEDPSTPFSQQVTFEVSAAETPDVTARVARLSLNGVEVRGGVAVPAGASASARFSLVDVEPGPSRFEVCVLDTVGNESCVSGDLIADLSDPGAITLTADVQNPRVPVASVSFSAPADDAGVGGVVTAYQVRWSRTPINSGDETQWGLATALPPYIATAAPGALETLDLSDRIPPNEPIYVAVRAEDDVGRLGPVRAALVDTRMPMTSALIPTLGAPWDDADILFNTGNSLHHIGDLNGDGYSDVLISTTQLNTASALSVLFGGDDLSAPTLSTFTLPANTIFMGSGAAAVGDINSDGAPDLAVLGYRGDFSGTVVALYLGCPALAPCAANDAGLSTHDALLSASGAFRGYVSAAGDVNGDGFADLLIGGDNSARRPVTLVLGRQTFPATLSVGSASLASGVIELAVPNIDNVGAYTDKAGDLDGDGLGDVIFSAGGNIDHAYVFYGAALEASPAAATFTFTGSDPNFIELTHPCAQLGTVNFGTYLRGGADLNNDARPDLVVGNYSNKQLMVLSSDFELLDCFVRSETRFATLFDVVGDINGDGNLDLITTHEDPAVVRASVFFNDGLGAFGEDRAPISRLVSLRIMEPAARKLAVSAAGDLNGDSRDDFVTLTWTAAGDLQLNVHY